MNCGRFHWGWSWVLGVVATIVLGGCGAVVEGAFESPSLFGVLGGNAEGRPPCVWIDTDDNRRYVLQMPEEYSVEFNPVRILRGGHVIAQEGDRVGVHQPASAGGEKLSEVGLEGCVPEKPGVTTWATFVSRVVGPE